MNEAITIGGVAAFSTIVPGLLMFFALSHAFKRYVQDAIGKKEETMTVIANQPVLVKDHIRHATWQELETAKAEWKQRHEEFEARAREFRERTETKLMLIDQHVIGLPHKVIALLRETKGLI